MNHSPNSSQAQSSQAQSSQAQSAQAHSSQTRVPTDAEVLVDARGTRCPMPVILAARAAQDLPPGTTLRVLATDPAAAADLPAWCRMRGHTVLDLVAEPGSFDCRVRLA